MAQWPVHIPISRLTTSYDSKSQGNKELALGFDIVLKLVQCSECYAIQRRYPVAVRFEMFVNLIPATYLTYYNN